MNSVAAIVLGVAVAVGLTIAAVVGHAERLRLDVSSVLKPIDMPLRADSHMFVEVDGPVSDVARGIQFGLLALLLGGVPMGVAARVLLRCGLTERLGESWSVVFHAGLVFQLSSVGLSTFLTGLLVWAALVSPIEAREVLPNAGPLLLIAACGAWGVPAWRRLRDAGGRGQPSAAGPRSVPS